MDKNRDQISSRRADDKGRDEQRIAREKRLAEQLRLNLRNRKIQSRLRRNSDKPERD